MSGASDELRAKYLEQITTVVPAFRLALIVITLLVVLAYQEPTRTSLWIEVGTYSIDTFLRADFERLRNLRVWEIALAIAAPLTTALVYRRVRGMVFRLLSNWGDLPSHIEKMKADKLTAIKARDAVDLILLKEVDDETKVIEAGLRHRSAIGEVAFGVALFGAYAAVFGSWLDCAVTVVAFALSIWCQWRNYQAIISSYLPLVFVKDSLLGKSISAEQLAIPKL